MLNKNIEKERRKSVVADATFFNNPLKMHFCYEEPPAHAQHQRPNKVCRAKIQRLLRAGLGDAGVHPMPDQCNPGSVVSCMAHVKMHSAPDATVSSRELEFHLW